MAEKKSTTQQSGQDQCLAEPFDPSIALECVPCRMCGSDAASTILTAPDVMNPRQRFHIVRCHHCDLAYTNPRPTPRSIGHYYPDDYSCHDVSAIWDERWRARLRRRLTRCVLRSSYQYPPQPVDFATKAMATLGRMWIRRSGYRCAWIPYRAGGRLLDFGCGAGTFLKMMRDLGWSVEGIDTSPRVAEAVKEKTGIHVHTGSLPHSGLCQGSYDLVTMWASLEHVHNPCAVVQAAYRLLRPGGQIIISVPNFGGWANLVFGEHWYGIQLPRHLTHFNSRTLGSLITSEGFHLHRIENVAMDGWIRKSARAARAAGVRSWFARWTDWKPLTRAVATWTEHFSRADSIVAFAERPHE